MGNCLDEILLLLLLLAMNDGDSVLWRLLAASFFLQQFRVFGLLCIRM